jgi:hypothetical protein
MGERRYGPAVQVHGPRRGPRPSFVSSEEAMKETPTREALAGAVALAFMLGGCGGAKCPTSPATAECPAPPPLRPYGKTLIAEGRLSGLGPSMLASIPFRLPTLGLLDATVDWTLTTDNVDVYIANESCTVEQFNKGYDGTCRFFDYSESTSAKPELVGASELGPGNLTLLIGNRGPDEESVSYQIFLTIGNEYSPPPLPF